MSQHRACAALLVVCTVLAGAPAASAESPSAPPASTAGVVAPTEDDGDTATPSGMGAGAKSWLCEHLGLFC